ncbi:MAG: hypothetical protein AAB588_00735 [Patescibacteria group bacterium]
MGLKTAAVLAGILFAGLIAYMWLGNNKTQPTTNPGVMAQYPGYSSGDPYDGVAPMPKESWKEKLSGAVGTAGAAVGAAAGKAWAGQTTLPTGWLDWLLVIAFFVALIAVRALLKKKNPEYTLAMIIIAVVVVGITMKAGASFIPSITVTAPKAIALGLIIVQCLALGLEKERVLNSISVLAAGAGLLWTLMTRGGTLFPFYPWWLAWVTWVWSAAPGVYGSSLEKGTKWIIVIAASLGLLWIA